MTGSEPRSSSHVYVSREPNLSHSGPIRRRASTVMATEAIIVLPICALVSIRSWRTIAISGAMPNQPKKHRKKANHVMWNVRTCGVLRLNKLIRVALFKISTVFPPWARRSG